MSERGSNNVSSSSDDEVEIASKKRKRSEKNWKDNKRKLFRLHGESYVTTSGKVMAAKSSGAPCT